jgi:hypothetical protein
VFIDEGFEMREQAGGQLLGYGLPDPLAALAEPQAHVRFLNGLAEQVLDCVEAGACPVANVACRLEAPEELACLEEGEAIECRPVVERNNQRGAAIVQEWHRHSPGVDDFSQLAVQMSVLVDEFGVGKGVWLAHIWISQCCVQAQFAGGEAVGDEDVDVAVKVVIDVWLVTESKRDRDLIMDTVDSEDLVPFLTTADEAGQTCGNTKGASAIRPRVEWTIGIPAGVAAVANHNFQIRYWFTIEFDCPVQYFDPLGVQHQ